MGTVTGLTAERMLEIEAASIIDGDVVGNDLILTRHDGTTIDAGSVKGPKGDPGSAGISVAQSGLPVLDVGIVGQIRAGRQLSVVDFTSMGLGTPIGLFNLSDLSNLGSGGPLVNKGAIPFDTGINGVASSAAKFTSKGANTQAFYISDTGAADPFRIRAGSLGCWFRTPKRGSQQFLLTKDSAIAGQRGWQLYANGNNGVSAVFSSDGTNFTNIAAGMSDVCDNRWHFAVAVIDSTTIKLYIDGVLEATVLANIPMFQSNGPFNIGAQFADATTGATSPIYGRVDEAFVTSDILSEDEIRSLYCAKIAHGSSVTPRSALINVHRKRKGAALAPGDFPTAPRRLYGFAAGSLTDAGVDNVALTLTGAAVTVPGADGSKDSAIFLSSTGSNYLTSASGGPSGTAARTYGAWIKALPFNVNQTIVAVGQAATAAAWLGIDTAGFARISDFSQGGSGGYVADGQWHFVVGLFDSVGIDDGLKLKLYVDGRLVGTSLQFAGSGDNSSGLAIGREAISSSSYLQSGVIDSVFITDYLLSPELIRSLYAKGAQDLGVSPKNAGDHVEKIDATDVYAIFDTLESQHVVDLAVAA